MYLNPYKKKFVFFQVVFNELCILVVNYHYYCFTNFVSDAEKKSLVGNSLIYLTCFDMFCNVVLTAWLVIAIPAFKHYRLYKKKYLMR